MVTEKIRLFLGYGEEHEEENAQAEEIAEKLAEIPGIEIDIVETKGIPFF